MEVMSGLRISATKRLHNRHYRDAINLVLEHPVTPSLHDPPQGLAADIEHCDSADAGCVDFAKTAMLRTVREGDCRGALGNRLGFSEAMCEMVLLSPDVKLP